tara:strand:- start:1288 stop:2031 length:744 start_codon:yes stop_codon:yes gene_type:complete
MSYLEGVYWDLDGTVANTEIEAHLPAFNKSFAELGLDWHWDVKTYINLLRINGGKNRIEFYSKYKNLNLSEDFIRSIHFEKQKFYLNLIKEGAVKLKTGVKRLIEELNKRNIRQFIVTSSSKIQVNLLVEILFKGVNPFEFFIASEDVEMVKPDPTPYLKARDLSGIKESNSIVFEDSIPGLKSSLSARMPTICVKSNIPTDFNNLPIQCLIDTLGDEKTHTNILIGPDMRDKFITYEYLINFLNNL